MKGTSLIEVAPLALAVGLGVQAGQARAQVAVDLASAATAFSATAPPGTYFLRVAGRSACGVGAMSADAVAAIGPGAGGGGGVVPVAPDGVAATLSGRVISLSWNSPTTGAAPTSYVVDVGTATGASNLGSFNTGTTATTVSGSVPAGRYFIRLRTRANTLLSAPSSEVVVDVP